ncbi:MAG: putative 2OG-Fe(II) oxygenase [Gammaproteobacteria bacterium]
MTIRDPRAQLSLAHQALTRGDLATATRDAEQMLGLYPRWPPAVHLAGLVARANGDLSRAEDLLRKSLQLPGVSGQMRAEYANNLGNLLRTAGYPAAAEAAYREAVAAHDLPQARIGLARVFLETDRPEEAAAVLARIPPVAATANVYLLLADALARTGQDATALKVLQQAGEPAIHTPAFRLAFAARLDTLGRHEEAEASLAPVLEGPHEPTARLALAELCVARRDWHRALQVLETGIHRHPDHPQLLSRHAAMAWMTGCGESFADGLRAALQRRPQDGELRLALVSGLGNAGFETESEALLREGLRLQPEAPLFNALLALRCAETARLEEARPAIARALAVAPELEYVREQAAIVALIGGETAAASEHTGWLISRRPIGQFAWALRVLALRMAGDATWETYAHPDRVCRSTLLAVPAGYASLEEFNAALAARLRERHTLSTHPLVNSVRGGTQVEIHPGAEQDPVLRAFLEAIRQPIDDYIATMPEDSAHPLFRRRRPGHRLSGCWTVRLHGSSGRHVSHIHPQGWISSAYYVTVPAEIPASRDRAGWLSFGRPPYPMAGMDSVGAVQPEPGRLALFPSYQWHGVEAFPGEGERMTIAFDVVPKGN